MEFEIIETERLLLRKITPDVYAYVFNNLNDEELKLFWGSTSDEGVNKERERHIKGLSMFNKTVLYFHLIDKISNQVLGACGYHTWYTLHNRAEIFYHLNDDMFKQKGLMSEAIVHVIDYGFNQMVLHRIEAFVSPKNEASLKLLYKNNFTKEGHLREHYNNNNIAMEDSLVLSLLKHEHKI